MAKRLIPSLNRILVEKVVPPSKTNAGILLPEKTPKLNSGKVIAVGPGARDRDGKNVAVPFKEGDIVLLPEYGGTEVKLADKDGWDLELEEAEAKDSETETEDDSTIPLINRSTTRNVDVPVLLKSPLQMKPGLIISAINDKSCIQTSGDQANQVAAMPANNLTSANGSHGSLISSVSAVNSKKNDCTLSPSTRISAAACLNAAREVITPRKSIDETQNTSLSTKIMSQEISNCENKLGKNANRDFESTASAKDGVQHRSEAFVPPVISEELNSNQIDRSRNSLLRKRKAEIMGTPPSSPTSRHHNFGACNFSLEAIVDTTNYICNSNKISPLLRSVKTDIPSESTAKSSFNVGTSTNVSISYKRKNLGKGKALCGDKQSETVSIDGQLAYGDGGVRKDVDLSANLSASLPASVSGSLTDSRPSAGALSTHVYNNGKSAEASHENAKNSGRELEPHVVNDKIQPGASTIKNKLCISSSDQKKCEVDKMEVSNVITANINVEAFDVQKQISELDNSLPPQTLDDGGNPSANKQGSTSDRQRKKLAIKKLGSRLRVIGRSYTAKQEPTSKKITSENGALTQSEKNNEANGAMISSNVIVADLLQNQVLFEENRMKVTSKCSSKSSRKKVKVDTSRVDTEDVVDDAGKENLPLKNSLMNSKCSARIEEDRNDETLRGENDKSRETYCKGSNSEGSKANFIVEPACFLLSGHHLLRKEFRQAIKRLRGKVCRDSHQWSYQATHFILPDPVRRTEKFFAAAAAGRWILKADYLAASNEAGRFLDEEPFEWYKNGLSEDGAINLAAPRRWRKLRERTGHSALYGMRILVYGECIIPSLDTLKRVVKAGDGTILATSPPYTRFLSSGVDFAIISPGMTRADVWVQEFLRHEIPCVLVDYLVEYVCKPGYPLDRHVLFNTNAWATRSFDNQQSRLDEIVFDASKISEEDDLPCILCGSDDRGKVKLICGNEAGTMGCGVGTHIDCCDPPLDAVPVEDWFCFKCCQSKLINKNVKGKKKGMSSKKRR